MYRSIYGSSLISTASGHFLSATLALLLQGTLREGILSSQDLPTPILALSQLLPMVSRQTLPQVQKTLSAPAELFSEHDHPKPSGSYTMFWGRLGAGREWPTEQFCVNLCHGWPKATVLDPRFSQGYYINMAFYCSTKCFQVFSFLFLCTHTSIITDKVLINYDWYVWFSHIRERKLNQQ